MADTNKNDNIFPQHLDTAWATEVDLHDDGLLWMINTSVFHPRGLALGRDSDTGKLYLLGDGCEPVIFSQEDATQGFERWRNLLDHHLNDFVIEDDGPEE